MGQWIKEDLFKNLPENTITIKKFLFIKLK